MTERLCIVCPVRGREKPNHYEHANVCDDCRTWLEALPGEIVRLWQRLGDDQPVTDSRSYEITVAFIGPLLDGQQRPILHTGEYRWNDPVAAHLPTLANGARIGGDIVSGSREAPVPVNLDLIDLTLPARQGSRAPFARGVLGLDDCQTGHLSAGTILDTIARTWISEPWCKAGHLPVPTVPALGQWLTRWMSQACDRHPAIDEDARDLRELRGTLRAVLGDHDPRPEHMGAPCPGCDLLTLIRRPGEDKVECANDDCRRVLTASEYEQWSRMTVAAERERMGA